MMVDAQRLPHPDHRAAAGEKDDGERIGIMRDQPPRRQRHPEHGHQHGQQGRHRDRDRLGRPAAEKGREEQFQPGDRQIGIAGVVTVVLHQVAVRVPVGVVVVSSRIKLNEPHSALHQPAGE